MPFVIGTAGHIDHGKTSLVKALTGQDTDRLKEEKERGISIDLGFAYLDLPSGVRAGVVDVPGHERFIRNMLAGAHGLDLVLFTVAADDGVMPQTEEHFEIVRRLGVTAGIFVLTKADLVTEARLREVEDEIAALAAGTPFADAPRLACSSVTRQGLDELVALIDARLQSVPERPSGGGFRLPVDRVFLMQGHGVVVTGTALDGEVSVGDRLRCLPGDQLFRVRAVHVHGDPVTTARAGQRVALNVAAQDKPAITRGHVMCAEDITATTTRCDVRLDVAASEEGGVRNHQRARFHVGTAERLATLVVLDPEGRLQAGAPGFCQVVLAEPVLVRRGDRFIVRDETAQRTIGGGTVIHPWAVKHRRREPGLLEGLAVLADGALDAVLTEFVRRSDAFAVPLQALQQFANLPGGDVARALASATGVRSFDLDGEVLYTTDERWQGLRTRLVAALAAYHAAQPLAPGMEMEPLREGLGDALSPRLFRAAVETLVAERLIVKEGSHLRLPSHAVRLDDGETRLVRTVTALLGKAPLSPPDIKQLEQDAGVGRPKLAEVLRVMERQRLVVRVSPELYFLPEAIEDVKVRLRQHLSTARDITPAAFRDLFDTTRKYTIPLLEFLDRSGTTVRVGDARRLRNASSPAR